MTLRYRPPIVSGRVFICAWTLLFSASSLTALEWNSTRTGVRDFYDAGNWLEGTAPAHPQVDQIKFAMGGSSVIADLSFSDSRTEQVLQGGLWIHGSSAAAGSVTLRMQKEHRLILDGGVLQFSVANGGTTPRLIAIVESGIVQLGTSARTASLQLGSNLAENNITRFAMEFRENSTLDTYNTSSITVAAEEHGQSKNLLLDLSAATLRSGTRLGALAVTDDIVIGAHYRRNPTNGRDIYGEMKLGAVNTIEAGRDLIIGHRAWGNTSALAAASGTLGVAAQSTPIVLHVGRDLRIGTGDRATGVIESDEDQSWQVTLGSASTPLAARGRLHIGTKDQPGSSGTPAHTIGAFTSGGGSFDAYLSELMIGVNALSEGTASGLLDFSKVELGTLEISGTAAIGQGAGATGELRLKGGSAASGDLVIGESSGSLRSLLELDGTLWEVEDELHVGALGDLRIRGDLNVGGLDLLGDFLISDGGVIDIRFDLEATTELLWGLRISGDQTALLTPYLSENRLTASGLYGDQATLHYDGFHTYYGLVAIPEPSTFALTAGLTLLSLRRIRRSIYA